MAFTLNINGTRTAPAPANDATVAASAVDPRGSQLAYSSLDFHFALRRANDLSQLADYRHPLSLFSCLGGLDPCRAHRARLSRVVTAALLSEVAEVVTLPDLRSEVPEDRVRDRNVEEEVG